MVWAGIMINGHTRLHVVANGTMTGQRYIDEVRLPHDCLDSEGIQRLVWPSCSPDLNPIENVWDALGRQVAGRNYPPTNKNTLIRALTEEWDKLHQQLLDNFMQKPICIESFTAKEVADAALGGKLCRDESGPQMLDKPLSRERLETAGPLFGPYQWCANEVWRVACKICGSPMASAFSTNKWWYSNSRLRCSTTESGELKRHDGLTALTKLWNGTSFSSSQRTME
ncbi:transposable element Tc1 transposase [Trichonephila clavipes]|nr:transposable element Tc1 transposase [Trichonephila clavipes]